MPPVKPNNQIGRRTRAQNRKAIKQTESDNEKPKGKMMKTLTSQTKSIKSANDTASDTDQPTISTGINNRKLAQTNDTKLTVKKNNFQSKPIIKDVAKRINSYSKQYTPQYFTTILEYMIEREIKNSMSPTASKIGKWREFVNKKQRIDDLVRKQVKKVRNMIITSRKKFEEDKAQQIQKINANNKLGYKIGNEGIQFDDDDDEEEGDQFVYVQQRQKNQRNMGKNYNLSHAPSIVANQHPTSHNLPNAPHKQNANQSSNQNSTNYLKRQTSENQQKQSYWLPSSVSQQSSSPKSDMYPIFNINITDDELNKQWDARFDSFAILIQSIYDLLGENQCLNTIFPACYIFYVMVTSDVSVFNYLSKDSTNGKQNTNNIYNFRSFDEQGYPHRSSISKSTPPQMLEYYMVVSLLIATKYHEIYPASLIDMIESINVSLSVEKALKIECQILQMLNFNEYFNDHQVKFLKMFIIVAAWTNNQTNVCEFILQSGLNNPKLYKYSPMYKAAVVIGLYEEKFFKTQQKFMMIKNLCPGLSLELATQIKKQYLSIIIYNHKNQFNMQKKKFFIFDKEMKNLIKKSNLNGID